VLGVGDDCALLAPSADEHWALSTDTLTEGVHFLPTVDPAALGHKALAVNLSDLAACGASPRCYLLALALPRIDEGWLGAFATGLNALAELHDCVLVGGDTTRSPVGATITITVLGTVPKGQALLRSGARPGDQLWLSGTVGDAALGLALQQGRAQAAPEQARTCIERLERPTPRVALGRALRTVATSAIDVSDGVLGDLGHIVAQSQVGAEVEWARLPRSPALQQQPEGVQQRWTLHGGDDYELLFTAAPERREEVESAARRGGVQVSRIGTITSTGRLVVLDADRRSLDTGTSAYEHFR
jgi:thiamine-monophosphate kinase